jgi:cupin fold WbuC family metalloprotein
MSNLNKIAKNCGPGVFHAKKWGLDITSDILESLIWEAKISLNRKARLCLHPSPGELLQITYLAFYSPYKDRVHCHPNRIETMIPIQGTAKFLTFDSGGALKKEILFKDNDCISVSTPKSIWHAIEVLSEVFVMIEVGMGPFSTNSTLYLED